MFKQNGLGVGFAGMGDAQPSTLPAGGRPWAFSSGFSMLASSSRTPSLSSPFTSPSSASSSRSLAPCRPAALRDAGHRGVGAAAPALPSASSSSRGLGVPRPPPPPPLRRLPVVGYH